MSAGSRQARRGLRPARRAARGVGAGRRGRRVSPPAGVGFRARALRGDRRARRARTGARRPRRMTELEGLTARWERASSPPCPSARPRAAAPVLARARLIHERTRIELLRLRDALPERPRGRRAGETHRRRLRRRGRVAGCARARPPRLVSASRLRNRAVIAPGASKDLAPRGRSLRTRCPSSTRPSSCLEAAMRGSWLRQTALTNNIANADTPNYRPQEVDFESTLQTAIEGGAVAERSRIRGPRSARRSRPQRRRREHRPGIGATGRKRSRLPGADTDRRHPQRDHPLGDRDPLMGLFDAIGIAGTGLTAERIRMDVTAENLANADTTKGANGQPYQRQSVVLAQVGHPPASAARCPARCRNRPAPSLQAASRSRGSSPTRRRTGASTTRPTPKPTPRAT